MTRPVVVFLASVLLFLALPTRSSSSAPSISDKDVKAVSQAIEDEIYDFAYQGWDFGYVGKTIGADEQQIHVYISPLEANVNMGGAKKPFGYVIYKYMPFGEVYRLFWFTKDGLVVLGGNPEFGFLPTHPNYLTVYMDDDELCRDKEAWLKASFVIQLHPTTERLREAAVRQKKRVGYSVRLDPGHRFVPAGRDPRCPVK